MRGTPGTRGTCGTCFEAREQCSDPTQDYNDDDDDDDNNDNDDDEDDDVSGGSGDVDDDEAADSSHLFQRHGNWIQSVHNSPKLVSTQRSPERSIDQRFDLSIVRSNDQSHVQPTSRRVEVSTRRRVDAWIGL